jgi:hypothetical protein
MILESCPAPNSEIECRIFEEFAERIKILTIIEIDGLPLTLKIFKEFSNLMLAIVFIADRR